MMAAPEKIVIIGAGSWGVALAHQLRAGAGSDVWLLARSEADCLTLRQGQVRQLPDLAQLAPFQVTVDTAILAQADLILVASPLSSYKVVSGQLSDHARADCPVVFCSKGMIEDPRKGGVFIPEYMAGAEGTDRPIAMLTGPSFADELLQGLPTAILAASPSETLRQMLADCYAGTALRVYQGNDMMGAAIGGSAKNVIAIAAGIIAGQGLGDNARAGLVTRGLAEMSRLARAAGGMADTISGLAGLGDLILSCASTHSRNMAFGFAIGAGTAHEGRLAEGRFAASLLAARARYHQIDMPICFAVDQIVNHNAPVAQTIKEVLARTPGDE